jgi:hypothetical protein
MKTIFPFLVLLSILISCNAKKEIIEPNHYLSSEQIDSLTNAVIVYIGKLPGKANHSNKFDTTFKSYYDELAQKHQLKYYYIDKDSGYQYFLYTRIAPSLYEKHVAIGGRLKRNAQNNLVYFEEIFRTWKMPTEELDLYADTLFRKMIKGESLESYYTKNTPDQFVIEFPSDNVYYDADNRVWVSLLEDPMEDLYKLREQTERDKALRSDLQENDVKK